jgi:glycosyltransferase involved in cell wall biosynthesis
MMRVFHLTWEFPPRIIGGIARHTFDLSRALAKRGAEVYVVTCNFPGSSEYENIDGVNVHRFEAYAAADSFLGWVLRMQKSMETKAIDLINLTGGLDLIHVHDWVSGVAGIGLKHLYRRPLVTTIHSTEYGRREGVHNNFQRSIHEIENWLCYEAWHIITCSSYMRDHVSWCFRQPKNRITHIQNGVDLTKWNFSIDCEDARKRFASKNEKIILFVGRMVHEKGLDTLIKALSILLRRGLQTKIVAVGEGPRREEYKRLAWNLGLSEKVYFTGHIDDHTLLSLYRVSDIAAFPSRFEPFGIVVLEAMATRCPVVVSAVGGLNEIVDQEATGLKVPTDDPLALASAIERILKDNELRGRFVEKAYERCLRHYTWDKIAEKTLKLYNKTIDEWDSGVWKPT